MFLTLTVNEVWQHSGRKLRCTICLTNWISFSEAKRHQDTDKHIKQLRVRDALPTTDFEPQSSYDIHLDLPQEQAPVEAWHSTSAVSTRALHGPALPEDPIGTLYDDWGRQLAVDASKRDDDAEFHALQVDSSPDAFHVCEDDNASDRTRDVDGIPVQQEPRREGAYASCVA
jgi:hypothetical protein